MKQILTLSFLFVSIVTFAQPTYDDCPAFDLGIAPFCDDVLLFNNVNATESDIGFDNFPPCFVGNPERDVWISFIASDTILDYQITLTGMEDIANGFPSIVNPQIAVYRGDCEFDGLQLLACESAAAGETTLEIELTGLTPGIPYFLRINDWSPSATPNSGAFKLCIIKKPPITTIDEGSSTACSGTLVDSGGEDGDYGNDENYIFTICPSQPHNCINFTLEYFAIENYSDQIIFYDGPNTSSPVIGALDGSGSSFDLDIDGGVCYSVSASSGCMTIQFSSDATGTYEGFLGHWECTANACQPLDQIEVDASATPEEIVQSVVSGQTLITITDINCPNGAVGTFLAGDNTDLGLEQGLLLSSGLAAEAANPATFFASQGFGAPGDPDLDYLSEQNGNGSLSNDACVVEMDVFAATDELTFEYIFGSEEYPNFVESPFNDIFAFLVSGPGITGDPNIGNQQNVAVLPNGTFIEINSVNPSENYYYYRNNENGMSVAYGGLTSDSIGIKKSLTARIPTIPCNTYHLKFAIADRSDDIYDSGVFISEIKAGSPNMEVQYNNGIDYLVEDCVNVPEELIISIDELNGDSATYSVEIGGTATLGVDYQLGVPGTITFTPDQMSFSYPIKVLSDGLVEGTETIEIQLVRDFGCGQQVLATLTIELHDQIDIQIFNDQVDTVKLCAGGCLLMDVAGGADYFWSPPGLFDDPNIANPTICPDTSLWVSVTGTLGLCSDVDSVFLEIIDPMVSILPDTSTITICETDSITLTALNNTNDVGITWQSFAITFDDPSNPVQTIVPPPFFNSIFVEVELEIAGCVVTDEISINVDPFDFPVVANDTTICQNYSVDLGSDIDNTTTSFMWTPSNTLSPGGNVSGPIATPDVTTTYTLIAESSSGACSDTATVTVTVIPADIDIQNPDTSYICLGEALDITAITSTGGDGVTWSPQDFMTITDPEHVTVSPPVSMWYYGTLETAACTVTDSVFVYVDSLPDLSITAVPAKPSYCQGEEVTLISNTYEPANFPGIELMWETPMPGALTPDSFLNLVFLAVDTHVYVRHATLHACSSTDSILINVVQVASMQVVPMVDTICPGESVQFNVIADPAVTDFSWSPPNGLSCSDCKDPLASPTTTTTYSVEGEFEGCPVGSQATVVVLPPPQLVLPNDTDICPGESVLLNAVDDPTATYHWTASDGSLDTNDPQPVVSPAATTTYFLQAENASCGLEAEVTILVAEDFELTLSDDVTICKGETTELVATTTSQNVNFTWTNESGNVIGNSGTLTVGPNSTMTYYLTVTDLANPPCFIKTDSVTVEVKDAPVVTGHEFVETNSDTLELYEGEEFVINVSTIPNPVPGGVFDWFLLGELLVTTNDTSSGPLIAPEVQQDQTFTYGVLITNENGCEVFEDFTVTVLNNPVDMPNVFTPNTDDQINPVFMPVSLVPIDIVQFKVWDRWGKLVYDNDSINGWDGKYPNGTEAPSDVYIYLVEYRIKGSTAGTKVLKGDVTLIR
ncbi:MAG: hypothetical protein CMN32_05885 [Saprospirales bacterium]|nr:hypothetical protein [Saprospirales bacterium]